MSHPKVTVAYRHNIFVRMMEFEKAGDTMEGHYHNYDHITLISAGAVRITKRNDDVEGIVSSEIVAAPALYLTKANQKHTIEALQDGTVASCVHAIREDDGTVIDPTPEMSDHTVMNRVRGPHDDLAAVATAATNQQTKIQAFVNDHGKVIRNEDSISE